MATKVKLSKINEIATNVKTNVDKNHALPKRKDYDWAEYGYLLARAVVYPKQDITPMKVSKAPSPKGNHISRQIKKVDYIHLAKKVISFAKKYGRLPNFVSWGNYKIRAKLYIYSFARIVVYTALKGKQPTYVNCNAKAFDKPSEPVNEVFAYFCKVFGINPTCIDDCLERVEGNGYGYYYDDVYSNKTSIDRMKKGYGVNCTDSCQVFYNIALEFIKRGKYKKVQCIHVGCSGGDGHVRLRIMTNDGEWFYRDPACCLSDNGNGYDCNWCMSGAEIWAYDPSWFMENLNR